jgi:hypothetical protein
MIIYSYERQPTFIFYLLTFIFHLYWNIEVKR